MSATVIGWDVGGVNTKVARVAAGQVLEARARPFEVQRDPAGLRVLLHALREEVGADPFARASAVSAHAVTMTAELSQLFRTKREGVRFVLDAVEGAFPGERVLVYAVDGRFLEPAPARCEPLAVAASNWAATARVVAPGWPNAVLVDIGTTTTDIIPIASGEVVARGRTDPERLREGELVYLGALRTPVEAITHEVPLGGARAGVSAEGFALAGDVHLWRGDLDPRDYTVPAPDGRPATREFARERLARVVCADRETIDDGGVDAIAEYVAEIQVARIAAALARVRERHPSISVAVTAGLGDFLAERAARRVGLEVVPLARTLGGDAARYAPAAAVALLLERAVGERSLEP